MKRIVLFFSLLLAAPGLTAAEKERTITTRSGKTFLNCKIVRVHPDGVSFIHQKGAAKIAFKELPESLRREFRYDPKKEAEYQRAQAELRKQEAERARLREIAMEEKLMEAQMAEASYLAAANTVYRPASGTPGMSLALPGETLQVAQTRPTWLGAPITGTPMGGRVYTRSSYSYWGNYPAGYGGGGFYPTVGYGYPFGGYGCAPAGAYVSPTIFRSWSVGGGVRVGLGISPFGTALRVFP
ncbi:MAG: hypothetical protein R3F13_09715 [Prosthecobacter sp.]